MKAKANQILPISLILGIAVIVLIQTFTGAATTTSGTTCTDSDSISTGTGNEKAGVVYTIAGNCRDSAGGGETDYCYSSTTLNEVYCSASTRKCVRTKYTCPKGMECKSGACKTLPCTDSDGALDLESSLFVKGDTTFQGSTWSDRCVLGQENKGNVLPVTACSGGANCIIQEFYCINEGDYYPPPPRKVGEKRDGDQRNCLYGCKDGACIKEVTCKDYDGPTTDERNYLYVYPNKKGTVSGRKVDGSTFSFTDTCFDNGRQVTTGPKAYEYWCEGTTPKSGARECPFGTTCKSGACIAS